MAGRPRRALRQLNYRRLHLIGLEADSSGDELTPGEELSEDQITVTVEESPDIQIEEDSDEQLTDEEIYVESGHNDSSHEAKDGTMWNTRNSTLSAPSWRSSLKNFEDGPKEAANNSGLTMVNVFKLLINDDVLQDICKYTNDYAQKEIATFNKDKAIDEKKKPWSNLNKMELEAFVGRLLLGGVEKPNKKPWHESWSLNETIRCASFPATMSLSRFCKLMSMLRFDDVLVRRKKKLIASNVPVQSTSKAAADAEPYNTLDPIKNISSRIISSFSKYFEPASKLSVDEQVVKFRGHCPFRVYLPRKPGKYGIKIWACVDAAAGYVLKLQVYQGHLDSGPEINQAQRVVLDLTSEYYGSHRTIIADNFFSSMSLVQALLDKELAYCGTLRKNRREIPTVMKDLTTADAHSSFFLYNDETCTTLVRYLPTRRTFVLLISSAHYDDEMVTTRKGDVKPAIIDFYNATKGGVDTADQMISTYTCQVPSKRWPMKLFLHLIDTCALNAYIIWMRNNPHWMETTKSRRRPFIRQLAYDLILPFIKFRASTVPFLQSYVRSAMQIMGITYASSSDLGSILISKRACNVGSKSCKQGRCPFDSPKTAEQTVSRRQCEKCGIFICKEHWRILCPSCITNDSEEEKSQTEEEILVIDAIEVVSENLEDEAGSGVEI